MALSGRRRGHDQGVLDLTIVDGKFTDQRIYVDNGPIDSYLS